MSLLDPRAYCVQSKRFVAGADGESVAGIDTERVQWTQDEVGGRWTMARVPDSDEHFEADLVLLAMGFLGPEAYALQQLGVQQVSELVFCSSIAQE